MSPHRNLLHPCPLSTQPPAGRGCCPSMLDLPMTQHCLWPGTAVSTPLLHLALAVTTVLRALTCGACHALCSHLLRLAGFWLHSQCGGEGARQGPAAHGLVLLHTGRWKNNCHLRGPGAWLCLPGEHGKEDWNLRSMSPPRADKHDCGLGAHHDLVQS